MRIISLVPSLTELLFDLGLENEVVGRTKFCIHPSDKIGSVAKIGGTKNVHIDIVKGLQPDLIIANKEENTKSDVEALQKICPVHITDIQNYESALSSIKEIGALTNTTKEAKNVVQKIENGFATLESSLGAKRSVCYLIWDDPIMTVGHDTFINDLLQKCGFINAFGDASRYPTISEEQLKATNPDFIFLSSEPYPFRQKHSDKFKSINPRSKVVLVDGEYFSWYGSRMSSASHYFKNLLNDLPE